MSHLVLLLAALAAAPAPRPKGDVLLLAWSASGELALVQETLHQPEGGSATSFRVVGPGVMQKHFEVANDLEGEGVQRPQKISAKECRAALVELRDLLRAKRFQGVTLDGEACKGDRSTAVSVAPAQAAAADDSELEPTPDGRALSLGDATVRVEPEALVLAGPDGTKRLRLPRPVHPANAHLRVSPSRRLLLVLESRESGDQVLAAGYSSKTGRVTAFE